MLVGWLSFRGLAIIYSQTEVCACAEVNVQSGRLWSVLFAHWTSTRTPGFTAWISR